MFLYFVVVFLSEEPKLRKGVRDVFLISFPLLVWCVFDPSKPLFLGSHGGFYTSCFFSIVLCTISRVS